MSWHGRLGSRVYLWLLMISVPSCLFGEGKEGDVLAIEGVCLRPEGPYCLVLV